MRLGTTILSLLLFTTIKLGGQAVTGSQVRLGFNKVGEFPKDFTIKATIGCIYDVTDISGYRRLPGEKIQITPTEKDRLYSYESDKKYAFEIKDGKLTKSNKIIFDIPIKFFPKSNGQVSNIFFPVKLEILKFGKIIYQRESTYARNPQEFDSNQGKNIEICFIIEQVGWMNGGQYPDIYMGVPRCDGKDQLTFVDNNK